VFVRLGSYLQPEDNRSPHKGVHVCHVLILFPVEQQPWKSMVGWMRTTATPFPRGSWIVGSGRILGVLDRNLIQRPQPADSTVRILVVLPDIWDFVRQNALSSSTPRSSNSYNESPTTPRPAVPVGVASRNPFSSPSRDQRLSPQKKAAPAESSQKHPVHGTTEAPSSPEAPLVSITADPDPVLTVPSSGMYPRLPDPRLF
jgi:hypothetical protein